MKVRKTGKSDKVKITFGERTDDRKLSKILALKTTSKVGQQITKGLYNKTKGKYPEDLRQVRVTIKGGYSERYSKQLLKDGVVNNQYHYFSFPSDPDTQWTRKEILKHVNKSMSEFTQQTDVKIAGTGKYESLAVPRISEVYIDYLYR